MAKHGSVASNAPDPDGNVIFRVNANGTLSDPSFQDGRGGSPFYIAFLHNQPNTFILGYAVGAESACAALTKTARIGVSKVVRSTQGEARSATLLAVRLPR